MKITGRIWKTALFLYFFSQILFLVYIQFPRTHNFDEFHYVPAAKETLELKRTRNQEHPPLAKFLMAGSIGAFGDRPVGWRFGSTFFGAITLVGMFFLSWVIFKNYEISLWVTTITLFNHLLYVQSRIGMLDTYMFGFLIWALVCFCSLWEPGLTPQNQKRLLLACGTLFGLSISCKWFTLFPWVTCISLIVLIRVLQHWKVSFSDTTSGEFVDDWYRPKLFFKISILQWLNYLVFLPLVVYFITFLPYYFVPGENFSLDDFFPRQYRMWDDQLRVISSHPYMSHWYQWPLMNRPIWYAFDREGNHFVRGVLLLGNPIVMWGGLIALFVCIWDWIRTRARIPFLILFFYSAFYFCWIIIPRKISFYYYYYPAGMMLSLALAYLFWVRLDDHQFKYMPYIRWAFAGAVMGMFIYFFPILAALKIPSETFRQWMWFRSWI